MTCIANETIEPKEHDEEIEITPAMIEAARDVFWGADWNTLERIKVPCGGGDLRYGWGIFCEKLLRSEISAIKRSYAANSAYASKGICEGLFRFLNRSCGSWVFGTSI